MGQKENLQNKIQESKQETNPTLSKTSNIEFQRLLQSINTISHDAYFKVLDEKLQEIENEKDTTKKKILITKCFADGIFEKNNKKYGSNPRKRIQINGVRFYEHRKLMEIQLGRPLRKDEHVHHINGDPTDNRIENLQIINPVEHGKLHKTKKI